jgi:hypothetical protein
VTGTLARLTGVLVRYRVLLSAVAIAALVTAGCTLATPQPVPSPHGSSGISASKVGAGSRPTRICNQPILDSPWHYDGPAGTFATSGTPAGLPTFGRAGTDFPHATKVIVVSAGDNTRAGVTATYQVNYAVIYFEPGTHELTKGMYAGDHSTYVGGYDAAHGKAVINGVDGATGGTGVGGSRLEVTHTIAHNAVDDTWEYLTVENFTAGRGSSVMGNIDDGTTDAGDTYKYNTIGPNEYGYTGPTTAPLTGQSNHGGYAIDAGPYTTVEYNCISHNAEGGVNISDSVNSVISHNEFGWNGLGVYPETTGPGASPWSCGCSAGLGKVFSSVNTTVTGNYVHDSYNIGIWFDTNNTGTDISHNYIAASWGSAIAYESSYNAVIADNTLVGNGWPADGPWPPGIASRDCFADQPCQLGFGVETRGGDGLSYATIATNNSGGDSALATIKIPASIKVPGCAGDCTVRSRYSGQLLIQRNKLVNNFGGISTYTDTSRFPDTTNHNQACDQPLGTLSQANSRTYYQQPNVLLTNADTTISGSSVASTGGTTTICADYGINTSAPYGTYQAAVRAPRLGMSVYDMNSGKYVGTVAIVASAHSFTLSGSPGDERSASLLLSDTGGCGPADYHGAISPGATSGTPAARYWDHCLWGSRNITVKDNYFSIDASTVDGCTAANGCGFMEITGFDAGISTIDHTWFNLPTEMETAARSGLNIRWSDNSYHWTGPGGWSFHAGPQTGTYDIPQFMWTHTDGQDAGSTFGR